VIAKFYEARDKNKGKGLFVKELIQKELKEFWQKK